MHNPEKLAVALEEYRKALRRQRDILQTQLEPLQRAWAALSQVYEGAGAERFRAGWERTTRMLEDYITAVDQLSPVLGERIEALSSTRPSGGELQ